MGALLDMWLITDRKHCHAAHDYNGIMSSRRNRYRFGKHHKSEILIMVTKVIIYSLTTTFKALCQVLK